jgi:hypothetical protein
VENASATNLGPSDSPISFTDSTRTIGMKAQKINVGDEYLFTLKAVVSEVA